MESIRGITAAVSHASMCVCAVNCYSPARDIFMVTCYEYTAYSSHSVCLTLTHKGRNSSSSKITTSLFTPEQATKVQRESRGIVILFL